MTNRQIFGYTEMRSPEVNEVVAYTAVHVNDDDGSFIFMQRARDGRHVELALPADSACELGLALLMEVRDIDRRENGLPVAKNPVP